MILSVSIPIITSMLPLGLYIVRVSLEALKEKS